MVWFPAGRDRQIESEKISMTTLHLQDPDNRDDQGVGFEFTGTIDQVIGYLDGPLRRDVMERSVHFVDYAIALLRARMFTPAFSYARQVGVYLTRSEVIGDDITVLGLGDDGDQWLVTGTSDAWAAEEAVRSHYYSVVGVELDEAEYSSEDLTVIRRDDWKWAIGGLTPSGEEDVLVHGIIEGQRFSGFMVTA